jgi:hypothetical protein
MTTERYGDWHIEHNPPPIPMRNCDWQFWHDDYDGAPDANDNRCGAAASLEEAKMEIDFIEDLEREPTPEEQARTQAFCGKGLKQVWRTMSLMRARELQEAVGEHPDGETVTVSGDHLRRLFAALDCLWAVPESFA